MPTKLPKLKYKEGCIARVGKQSCIYWQNSSSAHKLCMWLIQMYLNIHMHHGLVKHPDYKTIKYVEYHNIVWTFLPCSICRASDEKQRVHVSAARSCADEGMRVTVWKWQCLTCIIFPLPPHSQWKQAVVNGRGGSLQQHICIWQTLLSPFTHGIVWPGRGPHLAPETILSAQKHTSLINNCMPLFST